MSSTPTEIVVASANIAGGMRAGNAHPDKFRLLAEALTDQEFGVPDVVGLQEVIQVPEAGRDDLQEVQKELPGKWVPYFFPHLDSYEQPHPRKWSSQIFNAYFAAGQRILQGTGVLVRASHTILSLWSGMARASNEGSSVGRVMPIPDMIYCGNRDTEAYSLLMTRLKIGDRNLLFCCTHLSTLTREDPRRRARRPTTAARKTREATPSAIARRRAQAEWIVNYLEGYEAELKETEAIVLVGDFNCEPDAAELEGLADGDRLDLKHAHLGVPDEWGEQSGWTQCPRLPHTHRDNYHPTGEKRLLIDHVFVSQDLKVTGAIIVELDSLEEKSGKPGRISDHHPVVVRLLV